MKKFLKIIVAVLVISTLGLASFACSNAPRDAILVVDREANSGTRDAFESIFDLKNKVVSSQSHNSTGNIKSAVASDEYTIGYISQGSIDSSVIAVKVDGVAATEANILNKSYKAARPFNMITKKGEELSAAAQDFLKFVYSTDGQTIVHGKGLISAQTDEGATGLAYDTAKNSIATATVVLSGSTSMTEVTQALTEQYKKQQSNVTFSTTFGGSSVGKADVRKTGNGKADIGLVSSEISSDKDIADFETYKVATDGLAIVVNSKNKVNNLTTEQIQKIFMGEIKNWSELA